MALQGCTVSLSDFRPRVVTTIDIVAQFALGIGHGLPTTIVISIENDHDHDHKYDHAMTKYNEIWYLSANKFNTGY